MKINSAFSWEVLEQILINLLIALWKDGFKTDVCGGGQSVGGNSHPLMLVKMTHPARPNRTFELVSTPSDNDVFRFNLKLEVKGDLAYTGFLDVIDNAQEMLEEVRANLLI